VLFTCGRAITEADEQAIRLLPATAWQAAVGQDGTAPLPHIRLSVLSPATGPGCRATR
jgi:hypothetical protein